MIDVCICTHNPRRDVLALTISALANQNAEPNVFRVVVVDNASSPALSETILEPLAHRGISTLLIRESKPGLQHARIAATRHSSSDWVLWVDDDNEPSPDFIKNGMDFIKMHPEVGCFGGRLLLPNTAKHKKWFTPFLPFIGIRDPGNELMIEQVDRWTDAEPAGAGAWVHRKVMDEYIRRSEADESFFKLGRTGTNGLASCDDSIMMRGAIRCGMSCAYVPSLELRHHIDFARRSRFSYLIRLMYAYGISHVILESMLNGSQDTPPCYASKKHFLRLLLGVAKEGAQQSLAFGIGLVAYHLGVRSEYLRQGTVKK